MNKNRIFLPNYLHESFIAESLVYKFFKSQQNNAIYKHSMVYIRIIFILIQSILIYN